MAGQEPRNSTTHPIRSRSGTLLRALAALAAAALIVACAAPAGLGAHFTERELAHREDQVRRGLAGTRDRDAERTLTTLACRIAPAHCTGLRLYVVDSPRIQARAWPNGMLLVHKTLLTQLTDEAELAFALAHEIAHLALGHFHAPRTASLELAADAWAVRRLEALGYRRDAGITLLSRFAATEHLADEAARQRLQALRRAQ